MLPILAAGTSNLALAIAGVFVLGIGAQWIGWRTKFPAILLLLVFGFLAGPVLQLFPPDLFQSDALFPFVSIAVGIILFEGGLSLRADDLREVGKAVFNLITIGVLVTGVLAGLGAYFILGFNASMSVVLGALLTVTGPTVVIPILRQVRPEGRVGTIAKWEGITIDPVGAIGAVLILEIVVLLNEPHEGEGSIKGVIFEALQGLALEAFIGVGASVIGAALLILMLRRRLIPDYLQNPITLMVVVAVFALSNALQEEAGLLSTTLMGIWMANQHYVSVRRIVEFKEDLQVLFISILFIVLSARLDLSALDYVNAKSIAFVVFLLLVVRPLAVWLSARGTQLTNKEKIFLAWLAPRGIVAAAVAALFSFRLAPIFPGEADALVPTVFIVIVGTVSVYGLTITPLARWLGLAQPDAQGVLIVGARGLHTGRRIARAIQDAGFRVVMADSNPKNVRASQRAGLEAERVNVLAEHAVEELNLGGVGRLLALTPNEEVNALAALNFSELFESSELYQLAAKTERAEREGEIPLHLRGRPLFGENVTFATLQERFDGGAVIKSLPVGTRDTLETYTEEYADRFTPLFLVRGSKLTVFAEASGAPSAAPGDTLIALVDEPGSFTPLADDTVEGDEMAEQQTV